MQHMNGCMLVMVDIKIIKYHTQLHVKIWKTKKIHPVAAIVHIQKIRIKVIYPMANNDMLMKCFQMYIIMHIISYLCNQCETLFVGFWCDILFNEYITVY